MQGEKKIKGSAGLTLLFSSLGFFMGISGIALFGPAATMLREPMDLSATQVGWLVAMPALSGAFMRVIFGAWVDTNGGRKPFLTLKLIMLFSMIALASIIYFLYPEDLTFTWYPVMLLLGAAVGFGVDTFSVGIPQNSYWFRWKQQGTVLGVFAGFGNSGAGFFTLFMPFMISAFTLSGAYFFWAALVFIITLLYFIYAQNAPYFQLHKEGKGLPKEEAKKIAQKHGQEVFPGGSLIESLKEAARSWRNWMLVGTYFFSFGGFLALTAWKPTYWQDYHGISMSTAGIFAAIYGIITGLIRMPSGVLTDLMGGTRTNMLAFFLTALGAILLIFATEGLVAVAFTGSILMALGMGTANAAQFRLVPLYFPGSVGGASGWIGGLGGFGGTAIPPLMGYFVDLLGTPGYASGFWLFVGASAACIAATYLLRITWKPKPGQEVAPYSGYEYVPLPEEKPAEEEKVKDTA